MEDPERVVAAARGKKNFKHPWRWYFEFPMQLLACIASNQRGAICRATNIFCTLGPACWSEEKLAGLLDAGLGVARFNFSHGNHADHQAVLDRFRKVLPLPSLSRPPCHPPALLPPRQPLHVGWFWRGWACRAWPLLAAAAVGGCV